MDTNEQTTAEDTPELETVEQPEQSYYGRTTPRHTRKDLQEGDRVRFRLGERDHWREGTIERIVILVQCSSRSEEIGIYIRLESGKLAVVSAGIGIGTENPEHYLADIEKL